MSKGKSYVKEIWNPIKNFHRMHEKQEIESWIAFSLGVGVISFFLGEFLPISKNIELMNFSQEMLNNFITVAALFVSFSLTYLSLLLSSESKNVETLKKTFSEHFFDEKENAYSLYKVLVTEITYSIIWEIIFLIWCVMEKCIITFLPNKCIKIFFSLNITFFLYIIILIICIVKNIYYSFWKEPPATD